MAEALELGLTSALELAVGLMSTLELTMALEVVGTVPLPEGPAVG